MMHSSNPRRSRALEVGVTLVELLAVMAIIGVLAGLSLSALSNAGRSTAVDGASRVVRSALVRVRDDARVRKTPSELWCWPGDPSRLERVVGQEAGAWSFDGVDGLRVLYGRNGTSRLAGARINPNGLVRSCADLSSGGVLSDVDPFHEPARGFRFELDINPQDGDAAGEIAAFGTVWSLELTSGGGLQANVEVLGNSRAITVATAPGLIPAGSWSRIGFVCDGFEASLSVQGVVEARTALRKVDADAKVRPDGEVLPQDGLVRLDPGQGPQKLSFGRKKLDAFIDEVLYRTLGEAEDIELPNGVVFELQSPLLVRYERDGRLDPRIHEGRVTIPLSQEDDVRVLTIDQSGVIR